MNENSTQEFAVTAMDPYDFPLSVTGTWARRSSRTNGT